MERQEELLNRARQVIRELREKLAATEQGRSEEIAIIGMACRFPGGADSTERFWQLIETGAQTVGRVPNDRWNADAYYADSPASPGKISTRFAAFLDDVDRFDAAFFDISPREATQMDPQQRILLETAWHALEDAGLSRQDLAGSETGVFVGVHSLSMDYYLMQAADPESIGTYTGPGSGHDVIAGRLSYLLDLRGPSMAVNTACSSSLSAVHLACRSLDAGDCRTAIVGGVNVILRPETMMVASQLNVLSEDGHCRAFDARSGGFGRGEGCGVVVLRKLSDAIASGDQIYAVIRGSAMNQDGRTNGLTAPNGLSQRAVIRKALAAAGVNASSIGYVEAHGTGTELGDPIEVEALAEILGKAEAGSTPCVLGSVKANIGHLEGAAGVAGLMKAALVLKKRYFPPVAGLGELNPHFRLSGTRIAIPFTGRAWDQTEKRYASVSSFGWSGTNVHTVLEEATRPEAANASPDAVVVTVSAATPRALNSLAQSYADALSSLPQEQLRNFAWTSSTRRTARVYRLAVPGRDPHAIALALREKISQQPSERAASTELRLAFLYPNSSSEWHAQARLLLETEPLFRTCVENCAAAISGIAGWDLVTELKRPEAESRLAKPLYGDPVSFAVQAAFTELLRTKWGVQPNAVAGLGVGEVTAAFAAGVLQLEDAARFAFLRGRSVQSAGPGLLDRAAREFSVAAANINAASPRISLFSPGSATPIAWQDLRPEHWIRNIKEPAQLSALSSALLANSFNRYAEIGGSTGLRPPLVDGASTLGTQIDLVLANSLETSSEFGLIRLLAELFEAGVPINWKPLYGDGCVCVPLPPYPFERKRFWIETKAKTESPVVTAADDWFYETVWEPQPWSQLPGIRGLVVDEPANADTIWGVVCKPSMAALFVDAFNTCGIRALAVGSHSGIPEEVSAVLDLRALETDASAEELVIGATQLFQEVALRSSKIRVWLVTGGAEKVGNDIPLKSQCALRGFGVSIAAEYPENWGGLIDLDSNAPCDSAAAQAVVRHILAPDAEDHVALRCSKRFAARLVRVPASSRKHLSLDPEASYLVTGAFGGIGLNIAEWLVSRGARNLVLVSRSGISALEGKDEASRIRSETVRRLQSDGVKVRVEACDIGDPAQAERLFAALADDEPIRGIIHAAADIRLRPLPEITESDIHAAFHAKVDGAITLDRIARDLPLDFLVFFSSISSALGGRDSSVYGAANAVLEALAEERSRAGAPEFALIWGLWDVSIVAVNDEQATTIRRSGLSPMRPQAALDGMERVVTDRKRSTCLVADIDWSIRTPIFETARTSGFLEKIEKTLGSSESAPLTSFLQRLQTALPPQREDLLIELVANYVRQVFRMNESDSLDLQRGFFELGLDSLMSVELRNKLQTATGLRLPGTLTLNHPNVTAVAGYLHGKLFPVAAAETSRTASTASRERVSLPVDDSSICQLSDDEVHAALAAELSALDDGKGE